MIELYIAGGLLVLAQIVGIYALTTRKADVIFSVAMALMVGGAVVFAVFGVLYRLHHG